MWDFPEAIDLGKVASQIYRNEGLVSAVCHGVVGLLPVTDESGKSILAGRTVTGFSNEEEEANGTTNEVPFLAEDALKEKGANYQSGGAFSEVVHIDVYTNYYITHTKTRLFVLFCFLFGQRYVKGEFFSFIRVHFLKHLFRNDTLQLGPLVYY